jgi:Clostripain family
MRRARAEWTILLYMNADSNELETVALNTLADLAAIGSTPAVNIVVQLDRGAPAPNAAPGGWSYALRFHVAQSMPAHCDYALPGFANEVNMGAGQSLAEFVEWGTREFPSRHVMLVVWGHGQGYAISNEPAYMNARLALMKGYFTDEIISQIHTKPTLLQTAVVDHVTNDPLYVREMQLALEQRQHPPGKLDIIGFDSCLMAMIEVAHAVRNSADYMVASEEVEADAGWTYGWLRTLVREPEADPETLAIQIVDSARDEASSPRDQRTCRTPVETLSALRLSAVAKVTLMIDEFVAAMMAEGSRGRDAVLRARNSCQSFGVGITTHIHSIDLAYFLMRLATEPVSAEVRKAAERLRIAIRALVANNFATPEKQTSPYGAQGIAIYFPPEYKIMLADPYVGCYLGNDPDCPIIDFAELHRWKDFLLWLFQSQLHESATSFSIFNRLSVTAEEN